MTKKERKVETPPVFEKLQKRLDKLNAMIYELRDSVAREEWNRRNELCDKLVEGVKEMVPEKHEEMTILQSGFEDWVNELKKTNNQFEAIIKWFKVYESYRRIEIWKTEVNWSG